VFKMKRVSLILLSSVLVLVGGPLTVFLNCSWALGHSHESGHGANSHHHVTLPTDHAQVEIHCSKPAHAIGPMLRPAGTTQFNNFSVHKVPFSGSTLWAVLRPNSLGINLKYPCYGLPAPNLVSRGSSYRLFLSTFQI
jgi:hypothetical protein